MISKIPVIYVDEIGTIEAEIINDFEKLELKIDGVIFIGDNFNDFVPVDLENIPGRFKLNHLNELNDCTLIFKIPILVKDQYEDVPGFLKVEINLDSSETEYKTESHFGFSYSAKEIEIGKFQYFDTAFDILKTQLPVGIYPKCCYTCSYSDYSVYGSEFFGTMLCFRNIKETYLRVQTKEDYMEIMDQFEMQVQETYLCEDFSPRIRNTGYRG